MRKLLHFFKDWRNQSMYMVWLIRYSLPYLPKITLLLLLNITASLLGVGMAVISKEIIDSATSGGVIKQSVIFYIFIILLSLTITAASSLLSVVVNEKFSFGIRKQIYEKIVKSQWFNISKYHSGDLVTRLTSDAGVVADGIVNVLPAIIRLIIELFVTFFTLYYYQPLLAVLSLTMAPIVAVASYVLGRKTKSLQLKVQETESTYRSFMQESIENLLILKSFTNEDYAADRLTRLRDERFYWVFKRNRFNTASSLLMSLSFQLGYIVAFTFGSIQLSMNNITYGMMSVFLTLVNRIQAPIMALAQYVPKIASILASTERIIEIQNIEEEIKSSEHITAEQIGVTITNLSFGYTEDIILDDISISIRPGEFVALVGRSGIGKTTFIRLLMSFMDGMGGNIEYYNSIGEIEKANAGTRNYIAYVPQGNTLFSGTIRENILMGKLDATEEEINEVLRLAVAFEFVHELPKGLNTVIGEHGHGLSEGQAQRIAIARALITRAPFLLLDEATSSLDEKTELAVLSGISNLKPKPTCLLITHRRSVLKYCDREISLENKKIINFERSNLCQKVKQESFEGEVAGI